MIFLRAISSHTHLTLLPFISNHILTMCGELCGGYFTIPHIGFLLLLPMRFVQEFILSLKKVEGVFPSSCRIDWGDGKKWNKTYVITWWRQRYRYDVRLDRLKKITSIAYTKPLKVFGYTFTEFLGWCFKELNLIRKCSWAREREREREREVYKTKYIWLCIGKVLMSHRNCGSFYPSSSFALCLSSTSFWFLFDSIFINGLTLCP